MAEEVKFLPLPDWDDDEGQWYSELEKILIKSCPAAAAEMKQREEGIEADLGPFELYHICKHKVLGERGHYQAPFDSDARLPPRTIGEPLREKDKALAEWPWPPLEYQFTAGVVYVTRDENHSDMMKAVLRGYQVKDAVVYPVSRHKFDGMQGKKMRLICVAGQRVDIDKAWEEVVLPAYGRWDHYETMKNLPEYEEEATYGRFDRATFWVPPP